MAFDFGATVISNTSADVYGNNYGGVTSDSALDASTAGGTPVGDIITTGGAITATNAGDNGANPFFIGVLALVAIAIVWKLFHEWGRSHEEFSDIKVGLHNWGAVLILVFAGVPGVKALLQGVPWPWRNVNVWQSFVAYCLNA